MQKFTCTQCERTFKGESGLEWHLRHVHGETARDNQSARASMAEETPEKRKATFAELQEATKTVKWTSPLGGQIVRALISLDVLHRKDVPKEVLEQRRLTDPLPPIYIDLRGLG